jgi:hypothetical protein
VLILTALFCLNGPKIRRNTIFVPKDYQIRLDLSRIYP